MLAQWNSCWLLNQIHKNHLPERVQSRVRSVGNRRTAVSRAWVDLVLRGAGHQTSLFSIRPPGFSRVPRSRIRRRSEARCCRAQADRARIPSASEAVPTISFGSGRLVAIAALWNPSSVPQDRSRFMSLIRYVCPEIDTRNDLVDKYDNQ